MDALERYALQFVAHSLVALLVLEALVQLWRLRQPALRLRFHALALALPLVTVPVYHVAYLGWGSEAFRRHTALLDLEGWRVLDAAGWHPVAMALGVIVVVTSILVLVQEVLPAWRLLRGHWAWRPRPPSAEEGARLRTAVAHLPSSPALPPILIVDQDVMLAYVQGLARPALVLSAPILRLLASDELAGVIAHELAHLRRRDNWTGWPLLAARTALFFNPVALLVFRHVLDDMERVCDDEAVGATSNPLALASGLLKVGRPASEGERPAPREAWLSRLVGAKALADRSHQAVLEGRLRRLIHATPEPTVDFVGLRLGLAAAAVGSLLFFVV